MNADAKRCAVIYALPDRYWSWTVDLTSDATIEEALQQARAMASRARSDDQPDIPWESATVGVQGEVRPRTTVPRHGDRIEIYRPLAIDPKESRRARARRSTR